MAVASADIGPNENVALPVFIIIFTFLCAIGYTVLLAGKKGGFYMICVSMAFGLIFNLITGNYLQAFLNFINPVVTWLSIIKSWDEWDAIDRDHRRRYREYYELNPDSMFWDNGRKHKIWAIINTCLLFVFIFPLAMSIPAMIQSGKAQKAPDREAFDKHIRRALVLNICTYPCIALFIIMMNLVA